jgi:hypothetical protein
MECDQETLEKFFNRLRKLTEEDKTIISEFINERDKKMLSSCVDLYTEKYKDEENTDFYNYDNYNIWCRDHIRTNMDYYYYLREITTSQLFKLVKLSVKCLNVYNVNILDKTCNVVPRSSGRKNLRGTVDDYTCPPFNSSKYDDFEGVPGADGKYKAPRVTKRKRYDDDDDDDRRQKKGGKRTRKNKRRRKTRGRKGHKQYLSKRRKSA